MRAGREAERESFHAAVLILAVESDLAGAWAEVADWSVTPGGAPQGGDDVLLRLVMVDEDGETLGQPLYEVTNRTIASAFKLLRDPGYADRPAEVMTGDLGVGYLPTPSFARRLIDAQRANNALLLDPYDASILIQLGLFGAVVFE